ncbi:MAG TPA: hypothetical protein VMW57_07745 [Methyloceanibacter sp.]|nr:hypothetical protein [Methyloceanibacter sp.]
MSKLHRMSRGFYQAAVLVAAIALLLPCMANAVFAREIATCGASRGYGYYPKAGLGAFSDDAGKWGEDSISSGKFTLSQTSEKEFDLLITDASGRVFSAKQDWAFVHVCTENFIRI